MLCPACNKRIIANPIGRWYRKFQCPHCGARLRFTGHTNLMGVVGSIAFMFGAMYLAMQGTPALAAPVFQGAAATWILLTTASYLLRGVERDNGK
jgi:DNA-directed RNA polymerase subunit RPC12/RpoP